ncbi:T9SS type A sorting domain-containing protein [Winogradskyella sp. F6397]|uniref:T9SS type A sorting domain-containing protein n=1 Tax=Winogradskyella marina TaxID=2785530 RepID=A0ABS0EE74_9FLAO|nr:T9SS type A sorting domain-containing protein [Winogradskyella marina]MBF8148754.1 T9SS type A sorting domain-containing protein [Winogradskyella marina]
MKKQLLFTAALLFVALTAFGQATALDPLATDTQIRVADTDFSQTDGPFGASGNGVHVNATEAEVINGTISFDVVSSGEDFETSIIFHVRKLYGNSGSVNLTIDGTTEAFPLAQDAGAANLDAYETFSNLTFSQNVMITSTPKTITLDVNILKDAAAEAKFRFYWVRFTNEALSVDNFEIQETTVNVFPNPAKNSFQIDSNNSIERVELYNITGQLLKTYSEEANYDISDLATGIYIANIKTQFGSKTLRIVKE